jgi:hypothetical protein
VICGAQPETPGFSVGTSRSWVSQFSELSGTIFRSPTLAFGVILAPVGRRDDTANRIAAASATRCEIRINNAGFCGIVAKWTAAKKAADREYIGQCREFSVQNRFSAPASRRPMQRNPSRRLAAGRVSAQQTHEHERNAS